MQIRTLTLKELYEAYELVKTIYDLSYESFEDRIYEMKDRYTMIGVFEKDALLAYAGVDILTTLKEGRHLRVYEIIAKDQNTMQHLKDYLQDYAKIAAANEVIYEN